MSSDAIAKWFVFLSISFLWIAIDQVTKVMILENLRLGQTQVVIPGFLNWTYVNNPGAAFGFLGHLPEAFRSVFFLTIPPLAGGFIFFLVRQTSSSEVTQILALASIFGGAMGNFVDRLRFRFVVDFVDIYWGANFSWPAFNLADVAIVLGASILVLRVLKDMREQRHD